MADTKTDDKTEADRADATTAEASAANAAASSDDDKPDDPVEDSDVWKELDAQDKEDADEATPPDADRAEATPAGDDADATAGKSATPPDKAAGQETKTEDEIWTGASDAMRTAFKAAQDRATAAEAQDRRNRGSISGMQRQINDLTTKLEPPAKGEDADGQAGTEDDDEWDNFAKEYPEVAGPVEKRLSAKDARIDTLERTLATVSDTHKDQLYERNEERLTVKHPDWELVLGVEGSQENPVDVTASANRFATWLGQQPAYLQQAAMRNSGMIVDPEEASHVVEVYKLATGIGQSESAPGAGSPPAPGQTKPKALPGKRQRQIESAAAPRTHGPGPVTSGVPEEGDPEALWKGLEKAGL